MKHLSKNDIAIIKARIARGDPYVDIASDYRINQGRIADLKFGRIFADIEPAPAVPTNDNRPAPVDDLPLFRKR